MGLIAKRNTWPLLAAVAAAACGGPDVGHIPLTVSVSDSSGVVMVRNAGSDLLLPIAISRRIGVRSGAPEYQFHLVYHLAVDSTGSVWVVDSGESVREYDASGVFSGRLGGEGDGPGESPYGYGRVWVSDDIVAVWAANNVGLQLFNRDREYFATRPIALPSQRAYLVPMSPAGGQWTFMVETSIHHSDTEAETEWAVVRGPLTGDELDTLVVVSGPKLRAPPPRGGYSVVPYVEGHPDIAADATGRVFYSHPQEYRVEVYDSLGVLERVISRELAPKAMPDVLEDAVRDGIERYLRGDEGRAVDRRRVEDLMARALPPVPPEHLPFIGSILAGSEGQLWVERADLYPNPALRLVASATNFARPRWREEWKSDSQWDVFDPDGRYVGSVTLPAEFLPMVVRGATVYGSMLDEYDVQSVVAYRIEASAAN